VFVAHVEFQLEGLSLGHVDLEDEELVHDVEAGRDSYFLRPNSSVIMKVGLDLRWVWRQLNALATQVEDVALQILVKFFLHLSVAVGY